MISNTRLGTLLGAALLMATSAIGPGLLTQAAVFTTQFGASFGFVILASILLDVGAQVNVWRVIAVSQCGRKTSQMQYCRASVTHWRR
jgi:Mn2+/Fe2+ NRAMP family transporter